jgi:hypothetical protein
MPSLEAAVYGDAAMGKKYGFTRSSSSETPAASAKTATSSDLYPDCRATPDAYGFIIPTLIPFALRIRAQAAVTVVFPTPVSVAEKKHDLNKRTSLNRLINLQFDY